MRARDLAELTLLAALWGASFLFMRLGAAAFGPAALVFVRVAGASVLLLPLMLQRGQWPALRRHWRAIAWVGIVNSGLPFLLFMAAALVLTAGLSAIFNATAALWAAAIAWLWLGDKPTPSRALGLLLGFAGVLGLGLGSASLKAGDHGLSPALAVVCCVTATALYGYAANFAKRHLQGVPALAVATGSQLSSAALTAVPALLLWPAVPPPPGAWWAAAALAVGCTAVAYVLYFRLVANAGASNAMAVAYLVPAFGVLWGALFLGEHVTAGTWAGCAVILLGTALATGVLGGRLAKTPATQDQQHTAAKR